MMKSFSYFFFRRLFTAFDSTDRNLLCHNYTVYAAIDCKYYINENSLLSKNENFHSLSCLLSKKKVISF